MASSEIKITAEQEALQEIEQAIKANFAAARLRLQESCHEFRKEKLASQEAWLNQKLAQNNNFKEHILLRLQENIQHDANENDFPYSYLYVDSQGIQHCYYTATQDLACLVKAIINVDLKGLCVLANMGLIDNNATIKYRAPREADLVEYDFDYDIASLPSYVPLRVAFQQPDRLKAVEFLLQYDIKPSSGWLVYGDEWENCLLSDMIEFISVSTQNGHNITHELAQQLIAPLIIAGANVNARDTSHELPLHRALRKTTGMVRYILVNMLLNMAPIEYNRKNRRCTAIVSLIDNIEQKLDKTDLEKEKALFVQIKQIIYDDMHKQLAHQFEKTLVALDTISPTDLISNDADGITRKFQSQLLSIVNSYLFEESCYQDQRLTKMKKSQILNEARKTLLDPALANITEAFVNGASTDILKQYLPSVGHIVQSYGLNQELYLPSFKRGQKLSQEIATLAQDEVNAKLDSIESMDTFEQAVAYANIRLLQNIK